MSGICKHDMLQRQCPHCELSQSLADVARLEAKVRDMEDDHRAMGAVRATARPDAVVTLIHNGEGWGVMTWDDGAKHVKALIKALATEGDEVTPPCVVCDRPPPKEMPPLLHAAGMYCLCGNVNRRGCTCPHATQVCPVHSGS